MGRMKDVFMAICEAFPSSCPHCEAELSGFIDLDKLNKALDEVAKIARENAERRSALAKCEACDVYIRVSDQYPHTKRYKEWIAHNEEVKASGFGAEVCWRCWNKPPEDDPCPQVGTYPRPCGDCEYFDADMPTALKCKLGVPDYQSGMLVR